MLPKKDNLKKPKEYLRNYSKYSGIAFQMIAIILLGTWGGMKLDEYLNTPFPVFTLILVLISVALAIYSVVKNLLK